MKFYSDVLGLKLVVDAAPDFAMVQAGGSSGGSIGLLPLKWAVDRKLKKVTPAMRDGVHLEFSTPDLDKLYAKLKARGVHFDSPPEDRSWGERSAYAQDPDGYTLEFAQGERVRSVRRRSS
jgi:catechol 2,3-dioxygenase-like lactoylglutathione lyase family enzyme